MTLHFASPPAAPSADRPTWVRHGVIFVTMLTAVLLYLDRFCVGFAEPYIREGMGLTDAHMSWFFSAFFFSYALGQVPAGWLSDRYGARIMLTIYVLGWSFFTALIGAAETLFVLLLGRLGCGLFQAGAFPAAGGLIGRWAPFGSRGLASSIVAFGGRVGGAAAPILTAYFILFFVPLSVPTDIRAETLLDAGWLAATVAPWPAGAEKTRADGVVDQSLAGARVWSLLTSDARDVVARVAARHRERAGKSSAAQPDEGERRVLADALDQLRRNPDLYEAQAFRRANLSRDALAKLARREDGEALGAAESERFNRLLLEASFTDGIGKLYVRGWRPVMYLYGGAGLLVAALFWLCFRNRPEEHRRCNRAERELIAEGRPATAPSPHGRAGTIPLRYLCRNASLWGSSVAQFFTNLGWLFLVQLVPRYLMDVHRVPILERGWMSSVVLAVGILGMLTGGTLTDRLVRRCGLRWGRSLPMSLSRFTAAAGFALCLWFASSSSLNQPWLFTAGFALVAFSTDLGNPASWAFTQDVGGRHVGSVLGWGNMWGNLGAFVAPHVYYAVMGAQPTTAAWNRTFAVCAVAFVLSGLAALVIDASKPIVPPEG